MSIADNKQNASSPISDARTHIMTNSEGVEEALKDLSNARTYTTDLENVAQTLEENGVAVLPGVLSEKECGALVDGVWKVSNCILHFFLLSVHAPHASVYCGRSSCTR